jgi:AraC-like DNA-binding protein
VTFAGVPVNRAAIRRPASGYNSSMSRSPAPARTWQELLAACTRLAFEPHDIAAQLDAHGRYEVPLDEEFAFAIKLFHYSSRQHTRGATWHERLELFLPLDGRTLFQMGDELIELRRGDLLVVENLTLHHVVDFPGFNTRAIVVSFRPEFVYSLGSPSYDYTFLLPFYSRGKRGSRVLPLPAEPEACHAIQRLIECRFGAGDTPVQRAGCKAFLLQLLYELGRRFPASERQHWEFIRQQQRSLRLKALFDHVRDHYSERLSVGQAAHMVGMSQAQFMKTFKRVAGMTLVAYLNHVRLANGSRLLRETDLTIAEIATNVGFSDQSYFDKRFKRAFGRTPREFRAGLAGQNSPRN